MLCSKTARKLIITVIAAATMFSFAGCTRDSAPKQVESNGMELLAVKVDSSSDPVYVIKPDSVTSPGKTGKRLTPDVSSIELSPASKSVMYSETEEECIERLCIYSNPNGNEYDALSLLGRHKYSNKSEDAMMKQLKSASKTWHETIDAQVGEKCIVDFKVSKKTSVDLTDSKVADWKTAYSMEPEAYTNVKCIVSTNYVDNEITLSIDLVKIDGKWYLAKTDTLNIVKETVTDTLFN